MVGISGARPRPAAETSAILPIFRSPTSNDNRDDESRGWHRGASAGPERDHQEDRDAGR